MRHRVALATCAEFPGLDEDDALLLPAFEAIDVEAVPCVWNDGGVDWGGFDAVVLRETWDYTEDPRAFVSWVTAVDKVSHMVNPAKLVRWNMDKGYLGVLSSGGIPTVPTRFIEPGGYLRLPTEGQFVVKPTVSAGSRDTARYDARSDGMQAVGHAQRLLEAGRTVMVQPYVDSVDHDGETALLFIADRFSHAIRKGPLLDLNAAPTDALFAPETIDPRVASEEQHAVARAALDAIPSSLGEPLFARVDLLATDEGPVLLELELIEPSLFLLHGGDAASRLADAVLRAIGSLQT